MNNISTLSIDNVSLKQIEGVNTMIFKFEDMAIAKNLNALSQQKILKKTAYIEQRKIE